MIVHATESITKLNWSGDTIWTVAKPGGGGRAVITKSGGLVYAAPSYEFRWILADSSGRTFVHYYARAYDSDMEMLWDNTFEDFVDAKPSLSGDYIICMSSDSNRMVLVNSSDGSVAWDISLPDGKKVENFEPFLINGEDYFLIATFGGGTNLFIYDTIGTIVSQYALPFEESGAIEAKWKFKTYLEMMFSQNGKFLLILRNFEHYHFIQLY